ncbi:MAG: Tat pathway signal sequence domain protein, partial [Bacteroidetes bacterium]|nr:Tat pathway signal sequence domain protein [Bacteroidota bacterium]
MGRSDVTTHRRDNSRLPIGRLLLETKGEIISGEMRLDLWNAEVTATVKTNKGTVKLKSYIHSDDIVLLIEAECTGEEKNARFTWQADVAVDYRNETRFDDPPNPPAKIKSDKNGGTCIQTRVAGGGYATAWREVQKSDEERIIYLTIADSYPGNSAADDAKFSLNEVASKSLPQLNQQHRNWWHNFYPKSFISIPDTQAESFYWIQMYKLACATRSDRMVIDLLGPWYKKTNWPRVWWNLNIEIAYFPVYTSNHLELGESFTKMMDKNRKNFQRNAKELYGIDNGATVPHTTCYEGLRGDGSCAPDKYINPGDFTWALYNYWLHYRYSMDQSIISDQKLHAFFPLLKGSVNTYISILSEGDDKRWHLPVLMSPEYAEVADNNYNLSLLRWGCQTLLDICKSNNISDPLLPKWQEILDNLVEYPTDETGYMIGKDTP